MKKICALALTLALLILGSVNVFAVAVTNTNKYTEPIPLLVIKVSFDADGSGTDSRMDDLKIGQRDPSSPYYGEQWCYSDDEWWAEQLFSDNFYSLKSYYKYISNNKFWWSPVEETYTPAKYKGEANNGRYDGVNDGVVHVVLSGVKHPNTTLADTAEGNELSSIIKAASEYVDFAKYDKDGNGSISYEEMTILFVYGGLESSIARSNTSQFAFSTHAHVTSSSVNVTVDGVKVLTDSYVRVGESISSAQGSYLAYGTIAHELGHVLGAKDLYLSDGAEWWGSPGSLSLMGGGSKGLANGNGYTGTAPSSLDPYYILENGFADCITADTSQTEYTLYSHSSGKYNVLRIDTPNPNEYYLIENRSHSDADYDNNGLNADINGIVIWHINELAMKRYSHPNNGGEGHDVGITVLSPGGQHYAQTDVVAYTSETGSFDNHNYSFHTTGTWHMLLTDEQAENFHVTIDFLSEAGDEMTIRVNGIYDMPIQYKVTEYEYKSTQLGLEVDISKYYGNEVLSCTIALSTNEDMSNATVKTMELAEENVYKALFEDLTPGTDYYYTVEVIGKNATGVETKNVVTGKTDTPDKDIVATSYVISVYKGLKEGESAYNVTVKFGETFKYSFPMKKSGYAFCGWYLDKELTQKYDMNFTQNEAKDFTLYAKWMPENEVATLEIKGATATNKIFSVNVGETFITPELQVTEGFEGWFADAEYTVPFDFSAPVTQTGKITVYAKYEGVEATTVSEQTTVVSAETTVSAEQTTDVNTSEPTDDNGGSATVIIISVVAVVIVAGVAVTFVIIKKKK